jgi:hypothetical protein
MKILCRGQQLKPNDKLCQKLENNDKIFIVPNSARPIQRLVYVNYRQARRNMTSPYPTVQSQTRHNNSHSRLNNCLILARNFKESGKIYFLLFSQD